MSAILLRVQYSGVLLRRRKKNPKKREHDNLKKKDQYIKMTNWPSVDLLAKDTCFSTRVNKTTEIVLFFVERANINFPPL